MRRFLARFWTTLSEINGDGLYGIAYGGLVLFSFSVVHFFGFTYFSIGEIAPFVDLTAFSNLTFSVMAIAAFSSVIASLVSTIAMPIAFSLTNMAWFIRRRRRHTRIRAARRKLNGFNPAQGEFDVRINKRKAMIFRRSIHHSPKLMKQILRWVMALFLFSYIYLGPNYAVQAVFSIAFFIPILFVYSSVFIFIIDATWGLIEDDQGEIFSAYRAARRAGFFAYIRFSLSLQVQGATSSRGRLPEVLRRFVILNYGLIVVLFGLVYGEARSSFLIDNRSYIISSRIGGSDDVHSGSIILTTSSGVVFVDSIRGGYIFFPFGSISKISS